ncbi:hypothetical protein HMI54_001515 [Coelomomyces lativittatus]|nr:hypothetical protein HMI56_003017 [Coelomomyces lativittatus]KAJ1510519.1 hypothetical protein HMI54_001515 [Coelomomyces lativittatus]
MWPPALWVCWVGLVHVLFFKSVNVGHAQPMGEAVPRSSVNDLRVQVNFLEYTFYADPVPPHRRLPLYLVNNIYFSKIQRRRDPPTDVSPCSAKMYEVRSPTSSSSSSSSSSPLHVFELFNCHLSPCQPHVYSDFTQTGLPSFTSMNDFMDMNVTLQLTCAWPFQNHPSTSTSSNLTLPPLSSDTQDGVPMMKSFQREFVVTPRFRNLNFEGEIESTITR